MLSKGNVSQAVESLIQKGLLLREQDGADRRRIHLHPTTAAAAITVSLEDVRRQFQAEVFCGLSRATWSFMTESTTALRKTRKTPWRGRDGT